MNSVTHVAGPVVSIRSINRAVQRCAMCGEKLADSRGQMGCVGPDGEPPEFVHWEERHLIRVTEGNPTHSEDIGDFGDPAIDLPEDFCLSLVE